MPTEAHDNSKRRSLIVGSVGVLLLVAGAAAVVVSSSSSDSTPSLRVVDPTKALAANGHNNEVEEPNTIEFKLANLENDGACTVKVQLMPNWAPIGVKRIKALTADNYWDGAKFFRNIKGFIAQFGLAADPQETAKWDKKIRDDPVKHSNMANTLTFATAGEGTRTTQLFFNTADNQALDDQGFSPVGRIINAEGKKCVRKIRSSPDETGPDQSKVQDEGNQYLDNFARNHGVSFTKIVSANFA